MKAESTEQKKSEDNLPKRIGNYEFRQTLGRGTFGKVKEAIHLPTG